MTTQTAGEGAASNSFDALLGELDTMLKACTAEDDGKGGDKKIKKAAGAAGEGREGGEAEGTEGGEGSGDLEEEEGQPFGKSFTVQLPDGTTQEAYDGTELLKALHAENGALRADLVGAGNAFNAALGVMRAMQAQQTKQGGMLKSLTAEVTALRGQGTGRRSALSVHDKPATTTGGDGRPTVKPADVMHKAMALFNEGKMSGSDVRRIEAYQGRGIVAPPDVLERHPGLIG